MKNQEEPKHRCYKYHTTAHEMAFLDGLGSHSKHTGSPQSLLRKYLYTMDLRRTWEAINPNKVREHALKLLRSY